MLRDPVISWNSIHLTKLIVAHIIQKFGDFDGDLSFFTLPKRSDRWTLRCNAPAHTENLFLYDPF